MHPHFPFLDIYMQIHFLTLLLLSRYVSCDFKIRPLHVVVVLKRWCKNCECYDRRLKWRSILSCYSGRRWTCWRMNGLAATTRRVTNAITAYVNEWNASPALLLFPSYVNLFLFYICMYAVICIHMRVSK